MAEGADCSYFSMYSENYFENMVDILTQDNSTGCSDIDSSEGSSASDNWDNVSDNEEINGSDDTDGIEILNAEDIEYSDRSDDEDEQEANDVSVETQGECEMNEKCQNGTEARAFVRNSKGRVQTGFIDESKIPQRSKCLEAGKPDAIELPKPTWNYEAGLPSQSQVLNTGCPPVGILKSEFPQTDKTKQNFDRNDVKSERVKTSKSPVGNEAIQKKSDTPREEIDLEINLDKNDEKLPSLTERFLQIAKNLEAKSKRDLNNYKTQQELYPPVDATDKLGSILKRTSPSPYFDCFFGNELEKLKKQRRTVSFHDFPYNCNPFKYIFESHFFTKEVILLVVVLVLEGILYMYGCTIKEISVPSATKLKAVFQTIAQLVLRLIFVVLVLILAIIRSFITIKTFKMNKIKKRFGYKKEKKN